MKDFMNIPDEVIEILDSESLFLIKGGTDTAPITKVNNQGTMCDGINNQGGMCSGINNQGGACGITKP